MSCNQLSHSIDGEWIKWNNRFHLYIYAEIKTWQIIREACTNWKMSNSPKTYNMQYETGIYVEWTKSFKFTSDQPSPIMWVMQRHHNNPVCLVIYRYKNVFNRKLITFSKISNIIWNQIMILNDVPNYVNYCNILTIAACIHQQEIHIRLYGI